MWRFFSGREDFKEGTSYEPPELVSVVCGTAVFIRVALEIQPSRMVCLGGAGCQPASRMLSGLGAYGARSRIQCETPFHAPGWPGTAMNGWFISVNPCYFLGFCAARRPLDKDKRRQERALVAANGRAKFIRVHPC
jgi:hypothetical protein